MNQLRLLPENIRLRGQRITGAREYTEHRLGGPKQQKQVKALLDNSPTFTDLLKAVRLLKQYHDQKTPIRSLILTTWDDNPGKFWVIRDDDPNYRAICFSGMRCVVQFGDAEEALKAITTDTTDTIEEV